MNQTPWLISQRDEAGFTPLSQACAQGHLDMVKLLVAHSDVNSQAEFGAKEATPLHRGCFHGHVEVVQCLIDHQANLEAKNTDELTPLHIACVKGHLDVVKLLVSQGANLEAKDAKGKGVFQLAKTADIIGFLRQQGIKETGWNGQKALMEAAQEGKVDELQRLVRMGAKLNMVEQEGYNQGWNLLHHAAHKNQVEVTKFLLANGVNMHLKAAVNFHTPFFEAAHCGHLEVTKLLILSGSNMNVQDGVGTKTYLCNTIC